MTVLEESETARLIRMSDDRKILNLHFGPGWVGLDPKECPWAAKLVKEWRDPEEF